jgi:hypothetical protein
VSSVLTPSLVPVAPVQAGAHRPRLVVGALRPCPLRVQLEPLPLGGGRRPPRPPRPAPACGAPLPGWSEADERAWERAWADARPEPGARAQGAR